MLREHVDGALSHLPEYTIYYSTIFVVSRAEREDVYLVFIIQKNTYNQLLLEYCTRTVAVRSAHTRQVTGHFTAACRDRCEVRSPTILLGRTAVVLLGLSLRAMLCALPTRARRLHACSTVPHPSSNPSYATGTSLYSCRILLPASCYCRGYAHCIT